MGPPTLQFCRLSLAHKVKLFQNRNFYYIERYLFFLLLYIHDILRSSFTILIFYFLQKKGEKKNHQRGCFHNLSHRMSNPHGPSSVQSVTSDTSPHMALEINSETSGHVAQENQNQTYKCETSKSKCSLFISCMHAEILKQSDTYEFSN